MVNREAPVHIQRFKSGDGLGYFEPMGVVKGDSTSRGNVSTSETDLGTYTVLANSLRAAAGKVVRLTAWGKLAANGNTKTVKLYFGGTVVATLAAAATNDKDWVLEATIIQGASGAQTAVGRLYLEGAANELIFVTTPSETETANFIVKVTGESATSGDDILQKGFLVEFMN